MNKKIAALSLAAGFLAVPLSAKVSFSLDIEALMEGDGATTISDSGLLVLVVDAGGDGFSLPGSGNIVNGNDEIVTSWDLNEYDFNSPAITLVTESGITYEGDWDDDRLALFWFPELSSSNMTVTDTTAYGVFSDTKNLASGDNWRMPADGTLLHSLKFFTDAATLLVSMGDFPSALGYAVYSASNEPGNPTAPTSFEVVPSGNNMVLTWSGGSATGGYVVQRKKAGSSAWETVGTTDPGAKTFTDTYNIESGAAYDYQLYAIDSLEALAGPMISVEALRSRIIAFDSRAKMLTGVNKRTIDLSVTGSEELPVLLQAIGPSLHATGSVPASRPIPTDTALEMYYGIKPADVTDRLIATNDDWDLAPDPQLLEDIMGEYGAYPMYNHPELGDSAFLALVKEVAGGYTTPVFDPTESDGIAVVGIYDVDYLSDDPVDTRLTGVASRSFVGIGYENLRSSVNIVGDVPMKLLVRAQGPWLRDLSADDQFTSETTLDNPTMVLYKLVNGAWQEIASNDDWGSDNAATVQEIHAASDAVGLPRLTEGSADSALLMTVEPGIYHAIVEGVDDETGVAQIAIFEVPAE